MKHSSPLSPLALAGTILLCATQSVAQIAYTGGTYSENFDTLPTSTQTGAISNVIGASTAIPGLSGWSASKVAGNTSSPNLAADNGNGNSGALYSYGTTSSSERALGALASGSNALAFGAEFVNNTGGTVTSVTISFTTEVWRSSTSVKNILTFGYGFLDGGAVTSANYLAPATAATAEPNLDVVGPDPVTSNGALDGNDAANKTAVSRTINGLSWEPGTVLFIRWTDIDNTGSDAGLAVDDFSLSGVVSTGSDIPRGAGTVFTPSSFGGNAFTAADTAVFNGTAATVSVSGDVAAFGLKFVTDGYSVTGTASDSLSVESVILVEADTAASISAILAGGSGLIKTGAGTLALSGANTFTGPVTISAGRLTIGSDAALGAAGNDVTINGTLEVTATPFVLGAGRTISGTGSIVTPAGGSLTLAGPVASGALTVTGPQTLVFGGATNTLSTLTLSQTTNVQVTGGTLQPSGGITVNQSGGTSVIAGDIAFGVSGDRSVVVPAGTLELEGNVSLGGRLIKTGAGTLDLTGTSFSGTTGTNGGIRLGVQGGTPADGGTLVIGQTTGLGNLQMHFNSGTLNVTQPVTTAIGVSIGGRRGSDVSPVTITGASLTFEGSSSLFNASGATGELGFNVENITTINGTIPVVSTAGPIGSYIEFGGGGTLVIGGDASALTDNFAITDALTFVLNGSFGGKLIEVDPDAAIAGSGTFTGTTIAEDISDNRVRVFGLLSPTGVLTFKTALVLSSSSETVLTISGNVRGSGYDAVTVTTPVTDGSVTYQMTYGGALELNFTAPAVSGAYSLFAFGEYVGSTGSFSSVQLTGSHSTALDKSGSVWSGTHGGATFSFDESTGVLTVTGGSSPTSALENWRQSFFNTTENSGDAADAADPDGDGIPNLLEYATGSDPLSGNTSPVVIGKTASGEFLTLSFDRVTDPTITYTVLASDDLASGFTSVATYVGEDNDTVIYEDTVSLNTPGVRRFLRLEVSYGE